MIIATFHTIPQRFIGYQISNAINQTKRNKIRKFMNCRLLETVRQEPYHYKLALLLYLPQVPDTDLRQSWALGSVWLCGHPWWILDVTVALLQCTRKARHSWQLKTLKPHAFITRLTCGVGLFYGCWFMAEVLPSWKSWTNKWQKSLFIPWKGEEMLRGRETQLPKIGLVRNQAS